MILFLLLWLLFSIFSIQQLYKMYLDRFSIVHLFTFPSWVPMNFPDLRVGCFGELGGKNVNQCFIIYFLPCCLFPYFSDSKFMNVKMFDTAPQAIDTQFMFLFFSPYLSFPNSQLFGLHVYYSFHLLCSLVHFKYGSFLCFIISPKLLIS